MRIRVLNTPRIMHSNNTPPRALPRPSHTTVEEVGPAEELERSPTMDIEVDGLLLGRLLEEVEPAVGQLLPGTLLHSINKRAV